MIQLNLLVGLIFISQFLSAQTFTEKMGTPFGGIAIGPGNHISKLYVNNSVASAIEQVANDFDFMLYPNPPISDQINISYTSEEKGVLTASVLDLNGQLLKQQKEQVQIGEQFFSIDLKSLGKGSYILQLDDGKRTGARFFQK